MKLNIPFYSSFPTPGHPDGAHCVETSLQMILGYLEPDTNYSIDQIENITKRTPRKSSWSFDWSIWFADHGNNVKHYTTFNFEAFKIEGAEYIRKEYGDETADWQLANSNLEHARQIVDAY